MNIIQRSGHINFKDTPIRLSDALYRVPSMRPSTRCPDVSEKYQPVSTYDVVEALVKEQGYSIFSAKGSRGPWGLHEVRLRPNDGKELSDGTYAELVLLNANNGNHAMQFMGGLYRKWCDNGMCAGEGSALNFSVRHIGKAEDMAYRARVNMTDMIPKLAGVIEAWRARILEPKESLQLASVASEIRFPNVVGGVKDLDLLSIRRPEDSGDSLWAVFNRIQENVTAGGLSYVTEDNRKRRTMRSITAVASTTRINRKLWDAAEEILAN